jgi:aromatic ring-opening dioxygenase catalytic subunit (LigB family)
MIYDYYGFPAHTYQVQYPAQGSSTVAARTLELIKAAGLPASVDAKRGYDHGMFSPMALIYPEANVPVVQLSLLEGLSPVQHIALGRALTPLRDEDVLIIGSGLSYHNLRAFGPAGYSASAAFDKWLADTMLAEPTTRSQRLLDWENAPYARAAHPREEHLIPLMVAVGAAEYDTAKRAYHEDNFAGGLAISSYRLG